MLDDELDDDLLLDKDIEGSDDSDFETTGALDDDEGDLNSHRKPKIEKRINKLVKERNIEREEREKLANELAQLRARFEQEDAAKEQAFTESEINELRRQKVSALEEGDFEKAAELDEQLIEAKYIKRNQRQQPQREQQPEQQQVELPEAQKRWLEENDWFYSPLKAEKAQKAKAVYDQLLKKGYDPDDDETYEILDRQLNKQKPPPVASASRDAGTSRGSAKFTAQDAENMREWGLNPEDPIQRKEFLKNKAV